MNISEKDIGRVVWSIIRGWGTIICVENGGRYVRCNFNEMITWQYDFQGRFNPGDIYPELYWQEMEVVEKKMPARQIFYKFTNKNTGSVIFDTSNFCYRDRAAWEKEKGENSGTEFIRFIDPENP